MRALTVGVVLWLVQGWYATAVADQRCDPWVARIVSLQGRVDVRRVAAEQWQPVELNARYCHGDRFRVLANSRAAIELANDTILRLDQKTTLVLPAAPRDEGFWVDLIGGAVHLISRVRRGLEVRTPFVSAGLEGTEFVVRVLEDETRISVLEGRVAFDNEHGRLSLAAGQSAVAARGRAPVIRLDLRPEDAVHWALYYPAVLDADPAAEGTLVRAQRALSVGRSDEAGALVAAALASDPHNVPALALQAIVFLAQNDKSRALAVARRAVAIDPNSVVATLAQSYALQAHFDLEAARSAAQAAVEREPGNALAWVRLAELAAAQRDIAASRAAAEQATRRRPQLGRTHAVLGFAHLMQFEFEAARAAFARAIDLDSSDPLARLGLGLARIRQGALAEGRRDLEIAVSLDPGNSLLRSYLGKAYYEEGRDRRADTEFDLAKQLDPRDPTPWLYAAVLGQAQNRSVDALQQLNESIARNDHRAVYRSRLLLDEDLAMRSASLGRIYADLGFEQLALAEGWRSSQADPANFSAHRLLADSYGRLRRHEVARTSELLQAQMLQPLSLTPVQPRLALSDLYVLEQAGSAGPAFQEYSALFVRDQLRAQAALSLGTSGLLADELILSGLRDRAAVSLGQYHYESDGFRPNNDVSHDIYDLFAQYAVSDRLSVQAELRYQETESGDLRMRIGLGGDPDSRKDFFRRFGRLGMRYDATPRDTLLLSYAYANTDDHFSDSSEVVCPPALCGPFDVKEVFGSQTAVDSDSHTLELQWRGRRDRHNHVAGASLISENRVDRSRDQSQIIGPPAFFVAFPFLSPDPVVSTDAAPRDIDYWNAYWYSTVELSPRLEAVLGASLDGYFSELNDERRLFPKFGLIYRPLDSTSIRLGFSQGLKRPFASDQTLEPVQVAGLTQFFDDLNGSISKRYGIGVDSKLSAEVFVGGELSWRDLDYPGASVPTFTIKPQDETLHRAYAYWAPSSSWSLGGEYFYQHIVRPGEDYILSHRLPLSLRYRYARFTLGLGTTYSSQTVRTQLGAGGDDFWLLDAFVQYRLPNRAGMLSLGVNNIFDKGFEYEDDSAQSGEPLAPPFLPERSVAAQIRLNF